MRNCPLPCFLAFFCLFLLTVSSLLGDPSSAKAEASTADAYTHYILGNIEKNRANFHSALAHYRLAQDHGIPEPVVVRHIARIFVQQHDYEKAIQIVEDVLDRTPKEEALRLFLANLLLDFSRIEESFLQRAEVHFETVLFGNQQSEGALLGLARVAFAQSRPKAVEHWVEKLAGLRPTNINSLLFIARVKNSLDKGDEAFHYYQLALEVEPANEELLTELASLYEEEFYFDRAISIYKKLLEQHPENQKVLTHLAYCHFKLRHFRTALELLDLIEDGNDPYHLDLKAGILHQLKLYEGEVQHLLKLQTMVQERGEVTFRIARALLHIEPEQAEPYLRSSYAAFMKNGRRREILLSLYMIGVLLLKQNDYDGANTILEKIGGFERDISEPTSAYAQIALRSVFAKPEDSLTAIREAIAQNSPTPQLQSLLVLALKENGAYPASEREAQQLLDRNNEYLPFYFLLAGIHSSQRNFEDAESVLLRGSERFPENDTIFYQLGFIAESAGAHRRAERYFRQAIQINPDNANALNALSYLFAERSKNLNESLELAQQAVAHDNDNAAYLDTLGWAYYQLRRYDKAQHYLIKAKNLSDDPIIHEHLGDLYLRLEKPEKAIEIWRGIEYSDPDERKRIERKIEKAFER